MRHFILPFIGSALISAICFLLGYARGLIRARRALKCALIMLERHHIQQHMEQARMISSLADELRKQGGSPEQVVAALDRGGP